MPAEQGQRSSSLSSPQTNSRQIQHWTDDLVRRITREHRNPHWHGPGRLVQVALAAGLTFELAYVEYPATRGRERRLKNQGGTARMSPADRFYEWLLSDHPAAVEERARRHAAWLAHEQEGRAGLPRFVERNEPDRDAPEDIRELVKTARWLLGRQADRLAADAAEPKAERLARMRRDFEASRRVQGATGYRYPARYLGARAARQPIPPDPVGALGDRPVGLAGGTLRVQLVGPPFHLRLQVVPCFLLALRRSPTLLLQGSSAAHPALSRWSRPDKTSIGLVVGADPPRSVPRSAGDVQGGATPGVRHLRPHSTLTAG